MDFYSAALLLIGVSTIGSLIRVVIGPTIWDRLLGIGLSASKITLGVIIIGLSISESYIFDLALLFSVLGFLVTVLLARFVERRGVV
ncbi:MAG: pH regulation protein F [Spirochaetaceae bacterium]|nr:MAG: pH regulation protein F [Spirochaetaceae bacterium]